MAASKRKAPVPKRGRGRPPKLTDAAWEKIVEVVSAGNYREIAAQAAGIDPTTLSRWVNRPEPRYQEFRRALTAAEQTAHIKMVGLVVGAAESDAKHAEWWLERKFHDLWGRKDRHEHTGAGGGPIKWDLSSYSDEELAQLERLRLKGEGKA